MYLAVIPGRWLFSRTTPSWRIENPEEGFQRIVSERRARKIAGAVLDQRRTFPNAIVLATDRKDVTIENCQLVLPQRIRFLVVDGQHRLYAQKYSSNEADFACVIHVGLLEVDMAELFVEINDNQTRVPSSLRWDLVRLVRPEDDPTGVRAVDLIKGLNNEDESPLFQRIDMTGEQPQITIKQGSLAPEIRTLLRKNTVMSSEGYDVQLDVLTKFFAAIREREPRGWRKARGPLYRARVIRALLKLLPMVLQRINKPGERIKAKDFYAFIGRIDLEALSDDKVRAKQSYRGRYRGSHQFFWNAYYEAMKTAIHWTDPVLQDAVSPITRSNRLWAIEHRNIINYQTDQAFRTMGDHTPFDATTFPSCLKGPLLTQFNLSRVLLLFCADRATEFGLVTDVHTSFALRGDAIKDLIYRELPQDLAAHAEEGGLAV